MNLFLVQSICGIRTANYIRNHINSLKKYHFHDTSKNSPFSKMSHIEKDVFYLYEKGDNLAAYLYHIQKENPKSYSLICKTIQSIAPYFSDFFLEPNTEGYIRLFWQDLYTSTIYDTTDLSDGTMRFIALTTLFMQPNAPNCIIIDEPELGLHPVAIAKLAGMIQAAATRGKQVIIATQSVELLNYFEPNQVVTVNQVDGASHFKRLNANDLFAWLEEYNLGDLWQRNILIGGQP
jgi:predicted ATPase